MIRSQIPDRILAARRADIDRIPVAALAKMTRADLAERLVAAGEFRRRARLPRQPADMARMYADFTGEVLTTTDPHRAAELVKAAGVGHAAPRPLAPPAARPAARVPGRPALRKDGAPPQAAHRRIRVTHQPDGTIVTDIGLADDDGEPDGATKAAAYERQAAVVTDPGMRKGYLELARAERERAGAR